MRDYKIKYRTFNELLDVVLDDFQSYDKNSLIEPSQLIKVAKKINHQLLHRITKTKQCIVEFDESIAKLPDDLYTINFILYIKEDSFTNPSIEGDKKENVEVTDDDLDKMNPNEEVFITPYGNTYQIVQNKNYIRYRYNIVTRVKILKYKDLLNTQTSPVTAEIINDFLKLNVDSGKLYINYEGMLEDEEGNLLVLNHELVNDYYEYAIKRKIIENIFFNGEEVNMQNKIQLIEQRYREAKKEALSVANMFDFSEIEETIKINRIANYKRFYSMF